MDTPDAGNGESNRLAERQPYCGLMVSKTPRTVLPSAAAAVALELPAETMEPTVLSPELLPAAEGSAGKHSDDPAWDITRFL